MPALLRSNLPDALARRIGQQLIQGLIQPGQMLPTEIEIAEQQGVSRPVVRESIKSLAAKGMVLSRPGKGATIQALENWNTLDPSLIEWALSTPGRGNYLIDLVALRLIIEPAASALASQNPDDDARIRVVAAAARMRRDHQDQIKFPDSDFEFHREVFSAAKNIFLAPVFSAISIALLKSLTWHWDPARNLKTVVLHERVAEAIMNKDADEAKDATVDMLGDAQIFWESQLQRSRAEP